MLNRAEVMKTREMMTCRKRAAMFLFLIVDNYALVFRVVNIVLYVFRWLVLCFLEKRAKYAVVVQERPRFVKTRQIRMRSEFCLLILDNCTLAFRVVNIALYDFRWFAFRFIRKLGNMRSPYENTAEVMKTFCKGNNDGDKNNPKRLEIL